MDIPLQNAPQPRSEASVSIIRSGAPEIRAFPFQASRMSLHHTNSSLAWGEGEGYLRIRKSDTPNKPCLSRFASDGSGGRQLEW